MTLIPECIHALARATAIAAAALGGGVVICALLRRLDARLRAAVWVVLFVPFLTPAPLVGYAWGHFALSLVRHPLLGELFYVLILALRLAPVAALVLRVAPATASREAAYCHRLGVRGRASVPARAAFVLGLWGRPVGIALALTFLIAFGDFELATLLGVRTWTVTLFDAHAGGLALSPALGMVLPPVLIEAAVLFAVLTVAFGGRRLPAAPSGVVRRRGRVILAMVSACVVFALLLTTVVPLAIITRSMLPGLRAFAEAMRLMPEILAALLFAAAAAGLAWLGAGWIVDGGLRMPGRRRLLPAFALSVPGLLGPLVLSLLVLSLFQIPGLRAAYDTPAPLLLAHVLLLLPPAMLLRLLLQRARPGESLHAAALLQRSDHAAPRRAGRAIIRQLRGSGPFWAAFLLFCRAYFDMTAASVLAPVRMTPVFVRLYNLMHYGRTAVLSVMVCLALAAPLAALALAAAGTKLAAAVSDLTDARRGRAPAAPAASS